MPRREVDRRAFLAAGAAALGGAHLMSAACRGESDRELDAFVRAHMAERHVAGIAAALVDRERTVWAGAYGYADLERRTPMSLDALQNICSISKTFTTAALMQLWERGLVDLDDDVGAHAGFLVRNPRHPDRPITVRHLLTHTSSIRDGTWYNRMYRCGDPTVALADWIEGYLREDGDFHDPAESFHEWAPGDRWEYNNVAYGLVGHLVERISGEPFGAYCRAHLFDPLGMADTSWYLSELDLSRHVIPYTYVEGDEIRSPTWGGSPLGVIREGTGPTLPEGDGHHANCIYNHPNFPDGFLRTSVDQLAAAARAYLNGGALGGRTVLEERSMREMMQPLVDAPDRTQGLTWYAHSELRGKLVWGHGGSDPGINTDIRLLPEEGLAAIAFTNTWGGAPRAITERLLAVAPRW